MMGMGMGVGFSSPPPWTPAALGADLWGYGLPSSIVDTGGKASQWTDLHTTAHHLVQADAAKRLAYVAAGNPQGGPCVRGDGATNLWLACADTALAQPTWVLLAVKWTVQGTLSRLFDGAVLNTGCLYNTGGSTRGILFAGGSVEREATVDGAWHVLEVVISGAASWIAHDGGTKTIGNAGAANMVGFTLGIGGHFFNPALFDCSGWMIAKRTPSDADRAAAYDWMLKAAGLI